MYLVGCSLAIIYEQVPPTSEPMPIADPAAERMAASPPDEPPGIRPTWYGLLVRPYTLLDDSIHIQSSLTFVTPMGIPLILLRRIRLKIANIKNV